MAGELDGPRLEPQSGLAKRLVVFLHGYGADGNDLIDIGRAWQGLLPDTAFVSPHAPEPCGQAPVGKQWFPLFTRLLFRFVLHFWECGDDFGTAVTLLASSVIFSDLRPLRSVSLTVT